MSEDDAVAGRLTESGHELRQRVYFEDTDFSGRMYHARYLHFMERGRSDYLRLLGVRHHELATAGLSFAVRRMTVEFRAPATIDDLLTVHTSVRELGGARVLLSQQIRREPDLLVEATVTVALIGAAGRAVRLPEWVRTALRSPATHRQPRHAPHGRPA
jgi:acyl-CoA thioester hydrolase